jgi:hypothetical protein
MVESTDSKPLEKVDAPTSEVIKEMVEAFSETKASTQDLAEQAKQASETG